MEDAVPKDSMKCPFCAEIIRSGARQCRFCRNWLVDGQGNPVTPTPNPGSPPGAFQKAPSPTGTWKALIFTVFCPGLGVWKMGKKLRGAVVCMAVLVFFALYARESADRINKEFRKVMKSGNVNALAKSKPTENEEFWYDLAWYAYGFAFVDVFLVSWGMRSPGGPDAPGS